MTFDLTKFKTQTAQLSANLDGKIADCKKPILKNIEAERYDRLPYFVNLAGKFQAAKSIFDACQNAHPEISKESLIFYWARRLASYSQDTYSGRENDFRRSQMDGEKEAVGDILNLLEYGSCGSL
jgi:hypothetical protein